VAEGNNTYGLIVEKRPCHDGERRSKEDGVRPAAGIALFAGLLALTGCAAPRAVPPRPAETVAPGVCLDALSRSGAAYEIATIPVARRGCGLTEGVSLRQSQATIEPAATMSCPLALALTEFEARVIQPAAEKHLGARTTTIRQIGAYSCRVRTGGSGRLSNHAAGLAIDIAGFDMANGTHVLVKRDWRDPGPRGRFLREVARAACESFSVVLTPNTDVFHHDHIHLDIGRDRLCSV
jgi:hypothetical protein